jgi:hypothetical protein
MLPSALLCLGADAAAAGQVGGTLGVTVQVVAACSADLVGSAVALDPVCAETAAPVAVREEGEAASGGAGMMQSAPAIGLVAEGEADQRYLTIIY